MWPAVSGSSLGQINGSKGYCAGYINSYDIVVCFIIFRISFKGPKIYHLVLRKKTFDYTCWLITKNTAAYLHSLIIWLCHSHVLEEQPMKKSYVIHEVWYHTKNIELGVERPKVKSQYYLFLAMWTWVSTYPL